MISDAKKQGGLFFIYVGIITIVALFYRFYDLDKRGYFPGSDAPGYAGVVRTYRAGFDYIIRAKILNQHLGSMNDYLYENGGQIGTAAKDGILPIGLIGSIIFGNNANTILFTSAMFGVFTVIFLFYILSRTLNIFYSFMVSLLFAVSPYHIGFSREGLTVIFASFFLLAGVYFYVRFLKVNRSDYISLCGLSLGLGFLCHYNISPFIFVFFTYEAYRLILGRNGVKGILLLFIFAIIPLFLMDIFTRAIKFYGISQHIKLMDAYYPYFNALFNQLMAVSRGGSDIFEGQFYYFRSLLYYEGIVPCVLLIAAAVFIIRRGVKTNSGVGYFLLLIFLFPFIYFLKLQHTITDRAMLSFIPLWYIIIGYGLIDYKYRRMLMLFIAIAIVVSGFKSLDYFNYRSNFEQAVSYMKQNKGVRHITSVWSLSRLYAGRESAVNHAEPPYSAKLTKLRNIIYQKNPLVIDKIKSLYNDGYEYLVLNIPPTVSNELTEAAMDISPEYSTDNMICNDRGDGYDPALLRDKNGKYLYHFNVYDLGKVIDRMR